MLFLGLGFCDLPGTWNLPAFNLYMIQAFIIVLREGFESFLIVAITLAYLKKTAQGHLMPAVYWGIFFAILASAGLGYLFREGTGQSFWEGVMGIFAVILVGSLVIHMWRHGPHMKREMEARLSQVSSHISDWKSFLGVLLFTVLMIAREGMETVVLLLQVREPRFVTGIVLGLAAAILLSVAWARFSYLINMKRFFQVTGIFLLLFLVQVAIYSVHEFSEAGVLPYSEAIHIATEPYSPVGYYGKWFSLLIVAASAFWLLGAWILDRFKISSK